MKQLLLVILVCEMSFSFAQKPPTATLKSVLLEQLKTTHNKKDWFVPVNTAVEGLTAEQAMWKDSSGNHSVGQLTYHLVFWNTQSLAKLTGVKADVFSGNNEETFNNKLDKESWDNLVKKLDDVLTQLEKVVSAADDT
ncbi:MAG: DinB family protein, partial [Bacteroidota bacterium]